MKLDFDISAQEYSIIRDILEAHLPKGVTVWVFGSRAKNTTRFNSDLDLALKGTEALPKDVIPRLKDAFTDAPIAYRVDLVDMAEVSDSFAEVIRAQAVRFPIEPQGNVPKLRFPGFEGEWEASKVGRHAKVTTGSRDTKNRKDDGAYPFFVRSDNVEKIDTWALDCEAVITSGDGVGVGKNFHYINGKFDFHQRVYAIYGFGEDLDGYFFFQFFKEGFLRRVMRLSAKNSVDSVRMSMITDMPINLPTLPEQRKIASFLSAVDTKIAQLAGKKRLLEDYKKGCMQQLFSQEIRFKDDDGKDFPDWEEKRLGEITTFSKGKGISKADISEGGATPCIRYGEIYTVYREHITDVRSSTDIDPRVLYMSRSGDVIIPASGEDPLDMARACCVEDDGIALGGDINVLRGAPNGVFLAYYLNNAKRKEIASYAQGNSVVHLYGSQMRNLSIALPHPTEQRKIADFLSAIDRKIDLVGAELEHARSFKQWLLQQMFV